MGEREKKQKNLAVGIECLAFGADDRGFLPRGSRMW